MRFYFRSPPVMATSKFFTSLRRRPRSASFSSFLLSSVSSTFSRSQRHLFSNSRFDSSCDSPPIPSAFATGTFFSCSPGAAQTLGLFSSRFYSSRSEHDSEFDRVGSFAADSGADSASELGSVTGLGKLGFKEAAEGVIDSAAGDGLIFPVKVVISTLDALHEVTGLPWWAVIASSTVALRITILPLLITQLQKLKRIGELLPKLPPPLPPPLSGRSYIDQLLLFRKERKAVGCPSFLWFLASFSVQIPCFLIWMISVRRMSLDHHHGFDSGGALWFHNLTEYSHGVLGTVFPCLIAGLHFINVQVAFHNSSVEKVSDLFSLLAKFYKLYLKLLTVPIFAIGFCIPQGSLVYWVTNSSWTCIQQLCLKHPVIRTKLGLPDKDPSKAASSSDKTVISQISAPDSQISAPVSLTKGKRIYLENLSPEELLALAVQLLSKGRREKAIFLLRRVLDKEPDYVRALILMGQTLLQNGQFAEAVNFLERAISKLFLRHHPTEVEDVDLLIVASQWAGVAFIKQGNFVEGLAHLERVGNMKEPDDPKSKAHYFDALLLLASALSNVGRKAEATKYIRLAAAYDPAYKVYMEQCEADDDNFVKELVGSRRRDY